MQSLPLFLLGAGFNADANLEVSAREREDNCVYPLATDLARLCFGIDAPPDGKSIEDLFQQAEEQGNKEPVKKLVESLMLADYRIGANLLQSGSSNPYLRFFERFVGSHFLTFNYDSLPEILLLKRKRWYPHDGYGMKVEVELEHWAKQYENRTSSSLVLHLHGSFCIYTSTYTFEDRPGDDFQWMEDRPRPLFIFDPDIIGDRFRPFRRIEPGHDYETAEARVIAPVPGKAKKLSHPLAENICNFIRKICARARELIQTTASQLVVIGYSFNPHDRSSYDELLNTARLRGICVLLISPDAREVKERLSALYPTLVFAAQPYSFAEWVRRDFPGVAL